MLVAGGFYLFYPGSDVVSNNATEDATLSSVANEEEQASKGLNELQNSIQGIIADSVQDEIQEAVESEMKKSAETQK